MVFFNPAGRMTEGPGFHFRRERMCSLYGVMTGSVAHPSSYIMAAIGAFQRGEKRV